MDYGYDNNEVDKTIVRSERGFQRETVSENVAMELLQKVYVWMLFSLSFTGLTAYFVANSPALVETVFSNRIVFYGLMFAELALVIVLNMVLHKISFSLATAMFLAYSVINGVVMSSIFLCFTLSSIAQVFFITAATFGVMALYGHFTKTDLTRMGNLCLMGLFGIIIATVVNLFLESSTMQMVISYIGVLIFVGLTAYDSQKIKRLMMEQEQVDENSQKLAVVCALTLYLDFINLFLYLLRIFGDRK